MAKEINKFSDHDLLLRLEVKLEERFNSLYCEIKELKDDLIARVKALETRADKNDLSLAKIPFDTNADLLTWVERLKANTSFIIFIGGPIVALIIAFLSRFFARFFGF